MIEKVSLSDFKLSPMEEVERLIFDRVDSREWWIIPQASATGSQLAQLIEEEFYSSTPERAMAFDAAFIPAPAGGRPFALCLAKKIYMTPEELGQLLRAPNIDGSQDILATPDCPLFVATWLEGLRQKYGGKR